MSLPPRLTAQDLEQAFKRLLPRHATFETGTGPERCLQLCMAGEDLFETAIRELVDYADDTGLPLQLNQRKGGTIPGRIEFFKLFLHQRLSGKLKDEWFGILLDAWEDIKRLHGWPGETVNRNMLYTFQKASVVALEWIGAEKTTGRCHWYKEVEFDLIVRAQGT